MGFWFYFPIIAAILLIIGVTEFYAKKASNIESYYVANRGANVLLLTGTYVASWASITGLMGMSGSAYRLGIAWNQWTWGFWGVVFFTFLVGLPLRKLSSASEELTAGSDVIEGNKLLTPPDFFQLRFPNRWIRAISAAMLIIGLGLYAVGQLIGMSLALKFVGINYHLAVVIVTLFIIYTTTRAGTPGIIVNDTINMVTFLVAIIALFPFAIKAAGGMENLITVSSQYRPGLWSVTGYQNSIFALISFNLIWNFMTAGSPHLVQRAFTAKDDRTFLKSQVIAVFMVIAWTWLLYTATQTGWIFFPNLEGGASDNILPMVGLEVLPTVLAGVLMAGIFAVGFSTINTQVSNLGFSAARDVYQSLINPKASEKQMMSLTKTLIVVLTVAVGLLTLTRPGFIYEITSWGIAFYGAAYVPMFIAGFYWKRATTKGVLFGISLSSVVFIVLALMSSLGIYSLPGGLHPFLISLPVSILSVIVVSLLTQPSQGEMETANKIREILKRKTDVPAKASDYAVPVTIIILAVVFGIILTSMYTF